MDILSIVQKRFIARPFCRRYSKNGKHVLCATARKMTKTMSHDQGGKDIGEEIVAAYQVRLDFVKGIVENTHAVLEEFRLRREHISNGLRELLAKSESLRKKDFNTMMEEIMTVQRSREETVKATLEEFKAEEEHIVQKLQSLVGKGDNVRIKDLKRLLAQLKQQQQAREHTISGRVDEQLTKMQQEVMGMLEEFKKEREKTAVDWQRLMTARASNDSAPRELSALG